MVNNVAQTDVSFLALCKRILYTTRLANPACFSQAEGIHLSISTTSQKLRFPYHKFQHL